MFYLADQKNLKNKEMKLSALIKIAAFVIPISAILYFSLTYGVYKKDLVSSLEKSSSQLSDDKKALLDSVSIKNSNLSLKDTLIGKLQFQIKDLKLENSKLKKDEFSAVKYVQHLEANGMIDRDTVYLYVEVKRTKLIGPKSYIIIDPNKVINPIKK